MTESAPTSRAHIAAVTCALMIAQQVAGKAARDALFLSSFHTDRLPFAMAAGAVLSLAAVWLLSSLMARHSPAALTPTLFAVNGFCFLLEWVLQMRAPALAAVLVYLHTALFGPITISTFWSFINEHFDPHTAKTAVARVAGGGTLGGVLGGLAAWRASMLVEPGTILLFLGIVNAFATLGAMSTSNRDERGRPSMLPPVDTVSSKGMLSSFGTLQAAPFLRNLAILVALGAATSALLDYIFSTQAVAHFGKGQALLSFFSLFWLGVGVLSFVLQLTLGRVALEKLSLALNIAVLPGVILLGGAVGIAVPGLASASLLRGFEAIQRNTLFRSAYELMYAPIAEERKRTTKALIDIGFDRFGTVCGSGVALIALHAFSEHRSIVLLGMVLVLAVATFPVTRKLHVGYVEALEQSLFEGAQKLESPAMTDALADAGARALPEREQLIERLETLQPGGLSALLDPEVVPEDKDGAAHGVELSSPARVLSLAEQILSNDVNRVGRALERLEPRDPAVPCAILLLGRKEFHEVVQRALARLAPSIVGQLLDVLLDPTSDFDVRRRLPRVLRACKNQRAVEGLLLGLNDERFEVRYECGRALFVLTAGQHSLSVPQEKVVSGIQSEIRFSEQILNEPRTLADDDPSADEQERLIEGLKQDRVDRSLEHVFNMLCLILEREPVRVAFRALHHEDSKFRGTALEYLNTVLPDEVREIVWPYLGESAPLPAARSPKELLLDLERAELAT